MRRIEFGALLAAVDPPERTLAREALPLETRKALTDVDARWTAALLEEAPRIAAGDGDAPRRLAARGREAERAAALRKIDPGHPELRGRK